MKEFQQHPERYWLQVQGLKWQECTKQQFMDAENSAGFRSKFGQGHLATSGFSSGVFQGRITHGPVAQIEEQWGEHFSEFVQTVKEIGEKK